jgi:hypothetical protein
VVILIARHSRFDPLHGRTRAAHQSRSSPPLRLGEKSLLALPLSPHQPHGSPPRPLGTAAGGVGMMGLRRLLLLGLLTLAAAASEGDADPLYQYAPSCF